LQSLWFTQRIMKRRYRCIRDINYYTIHFPWKIHFLIKPWRYAQRWKSYTTNNLYSIKAQRCKRKCIKFFTDIIYRRQLIRTVQPLYIKSCRMPSLKRKSKYLFWILQNAFLKNTTYIEVLGPREINRYTMTLHGVTLPTNMYCEYYY